MGSDFTVSSRSACFGEQHFCLFHQLKEFLEFDGPPLKADHLVFVNRVYKSCESLLFSRFKEFYQWFELR